MPDAVSTEWVFKFLVTVLPAVAAFVAVRLGLKQVVADVAELKGKTESKDESHDSSLANHNTRIAVLEVRFDEAITSMKEQLDKIYQKLFS